MADSGQHKSFLETRDAQEVFDRARTTAVELARLILTLATGTIGAIALAVLHASPTAHFTNLQSALIAATLTVLVLTIALALVGIAADVASDASWGFALFYNEQQKTGHWHKSRNRWRRVRKALLGAAAIGFIAGIVCAGLFVMTFV
jgi:hypothetical protein